MQRKLEDLVKRPAFAASFILAASVTLPAQSPRPAPSAEFIVRPGAAGNLELGQTVDHLYKQFGHERIRLHATFPEGMFQPVLEIRLAANDPGPALVVRVGEWPCPEYRVTGISVLDRRFRTAHGLGVGSTFADIRKLHPKARKGWGESQRVVVVEEAGVTFMIEPDDALGDAAVVTSMWVIGRDAAAIRKKHCHGGRAD